MRAPDIHPSVLRTADMLDQHDKIEELEHRLAVANQLILILEKRLKHAEGETAQARVSRNTVEASRDVYKAQVMVLLVAMKEAGLCIEVISEEVQRAAVG